MPAGIYRITRLANAIMPKKGGKSKDKEKEKAAAAAAAATTTAGVEAMEVRHILMEKHSACLKVSDWTVCSVFWRVERGTETGESL